MRQLRVRLRSLTVFLLTTLSFSFLITLNTLIKSSDELEPFVEPPKRPEDISIWTAFNQRNKHDSPAIKSSLPSIIHYSSLISPSRIDELFQLLRQTQSQSTTRATSNFTLKLDNWRPVNEANDTNPIPEKEESISTGQSPVKIVNEQDRLQLRTFVQQRIRRWKDEHHNDTKITLGEIMHESLAQDEPGRLNTSWFQYIKTVSNQRVYDPNTLQFQSLRQHLQKGQILQASEMSQGTQIKVVLDLTEGFQALLKPYRVPRNYQTQPDHFYFNDVERHHAEIGAFHLDKVLGFNRVPPVIGRVFNVTRDIRNKATEELGKTFFISPANNTCFRGHCTYYCDTSHAVCGQRGDRLEGSVQVLLPRPPEVDWQKLTHPYRRSYSSTRQAKWEISENFCYERVMIDEDYHTRLLLDMMDLSAFDFLIGNLDRHHMMRISGLGSNSALVHLDNGRSFGRHDTDDLSILAPIRQCCFFRSSTFARLYKVYRRGLSKLLFTSLSQNENLPNLLINEHLIAVDRRLEILFAHLDQCIRRYSLPNVLLDDGID